MIIHSWLNEGTDHAKKGKKMRPFWDLLKTRWPVHLMKFAMVCSWFELTFENTKFIVFWGFSNRELWEKPYKLSKIRLILWVFLIVAPEKKNEKKYMIQTFRLRREFGYSSWRRKHLLVDNKYLLQVSQEVSPDRRNKGLWYGRTLKILSHISALVKRRMWELYQISWLFSSI